MQLSIFNLSPAAIFFSLGFRASVHKPTNNLTTYSLLCWWAQMDSNHRPKTVKRFSQKISTAFRSISSVL